MCKSTVYKTADGCLAWHKSFTYYSVPFTCSTFLLPTSSLLYWPCSVFCQPPSFPPSLPPSSPSLLLSLPPLLPFSVAPSLPLSLSSFTRVARSDGHSDHRGNLWEKVVWFLARLWRERRSKRLRKTLCSLCVCVRQREREREKEEERGWNKGGEKLVWSRMLSGGLCVSCKGAEGSSLGFQSLQC